MSDYYLLKSIEDPVLRDLVRTIWGISDRTPNEVDLMDLMENNKTRSGPADWLSVARAHPGVFDAIDAYGEDLPEGWPGRWPWRNARKWTLIQLSDSIRLSASGRWTKDKLTAVLIGMERAYKQATVDAPKDAGICFQRNFPRPLDSDSWARAVQKNPTIFYAAPRLIEAINPSWPREESERRSRLKKELIEEARKYSMTFTGITEDLATSKGNTHGEALVAALEEAPNVEEAVKSQARREQKQRMWKDNILVSEDLKLKYAKEIEIVKNEAMKVEKEGLIGALEKTESMLKHAAPDGVKIGIAHRVTSEVISKMEKNANYPEILKSAPCRKAIAAALPVLVFFATSTEAGQKYIPADKHLTAWASHATRGAFANGASDISAALLPLFAMMGVMVKQAFNSVGFSVGDDGDIKALEHKPDIAEELEAAALRAELAALRKEVAELREVRGED